MNKGQIQITFNWIYIMIAGAVILLFFIGIVVKQKAASEEKLAIDVVNIMESIFTSAGVSEKTKNVIDTSGLTDYTFFFDCQEGVGEYGIKDNPAQSQNAVDPVFAPKELQSTKFITWSLPYELPFKVMDLLFITTINTKYVVLGNTAFAQEFLLATEDDFNVVETADGLEPGRNFQIRIVDTDGSFVQDGQPVPVSLQRMDNDKVTAVQFESEQVNTNVFYYRKNDEGNWKILNRADPVPIVSLGGERDAARFAAVFASDHTTYWCNMQKVLTRLGLITQVYSGKLESLKTRYGERQESGHRIGSCLGHISGFDDDIEDPLRLMSSSVSVCKESKQCVELVSSADEITRVNERMGVDCIALY